MSKTTFTVHTRTNLIFLTQACLPVIFLLSCTPAPKVSPAFYHWQTDLAPTAYEADFYQKTKAQKLYAKFFDIDLQGGRPVPQAIINTADYRPLPDTEIIPVVFITNRTFKNSDAAQIEDLATKTLTKIQSLFAAIPKQKLTEIQFDCDWSQSTKNAYFTFLRSIEKQLPHPEMYLTATVRLHQIKYAESTGVPPVRRGTLMYYNTGNLRDPETENSILDNRTAALYLDNLSDYPKPLDLALPLFKWGVLFREGKMIRLLNNLQAEDLRDTLYYEQTDRHRFFVKENTWLSGHYVYQKDEIRMEGIDIERLQTAARTLAPLWQTDDFTLTFYHLDSAVVQQFRPENLLELQEVLRRGGDTDF